MNKKSHLKQQAEQKKKDKYESKLWYGGIKFSSLFEVDVVKYLDQLDIKWERNEKLFSVLMDDGRTLHYMPDLFLPDYNSYCEIKGIWFSKEKRIKTYKAVEQNNLNWIYILLKEWKQSKKILRSRIDHLRIKQFKSNNAKEPSL